MADNEASLLIRIKQKGLEKLDKIKAGIKGIAKVVALVKVAILGLGAVAIRAFAQQEAAVNRLNQAMVNNGDFTRAASKDMQEFASSLQEASVHGDEMLLNMMSLAKSFGFTNEETKKVTQAAVDLAAATGISLESAIRNLGKTTAGLAGELGEVIPELRSMTAEQLKAGEAIDLVANKFKGAGKAQTEGLGALTQMKNAVGDLVETFGEKLAPFIIKAAQSISKFTTELKKNKQFLEGLETGVLILAKAFTVLKAAVVGAGEQIFNVLKTSFNAIQSAIKGDFSAIGSIISEGVKKSFTLAIDRKVTFLEEWNALDEVQAEADDQKRAMELEKEKQSEINKAAIKNKARVSDFTEAQKHAAKILGIELKTKDDIKKIEQEKIKQRGKFLGQISTLQSSSNQALATVGKAAAIAQITISTGEAAMAGFKWGMLMGGPGLAAAFQGLALAAGAAQIATVSGVKLAEGGIVKASTGGTQAIIGEGGSDEAVIPLDDDEAQERLNGSGSITINFNGPTLGDPAQADMFARKIDEKLFELRQTNQSVAFDGETF